MNDESTMESIKLRKSIRITWNVRSMLQLGKVQTLGSELDRLGVDVCGLSEVRWEGLVDFRAPQGHTIAYCGKEEQDKHSIAVLVHKRVASAMMGYEPISKRIISVHLNASPKKDYTAASLRTDYNYI